MRVLLHTIVRRTGGNREDRTYFEGDSLVIGRGSDAGLRLESLRVAARHAEILPTRDGGFIIVALIASGVSLNGLRTESAPVTAGDIIRIGPYQIRAKAKAANCDLALEIEKVQEDAGYSLSQIEAFRARNILKETGLSLRAWSWAAVVLVTAAFLVLPILGGSVPYLGELQRKFLPPVSDLAWDPGPLMRGHQHLSNDCNRCHQSAFIQVDNEACLQCHLKVSHHFDPRAIKLSENAEFDCVECHVQHQGGDLAQLNLDSACLDCHEDLKSLATNSRLLDVGAGFAEDHPQFRAKLLRNDGTRDRQIWVSMDEKTNTQTSQLREESNLFFSHQFHLSEAACRSEAQKLCKPEKGQTLQCENCHKSEKQGEHMAPVQFEQNCHACHPLTYDPAEPQKEVPHGNKKKVISVLSENFLALAIECKLSPQKIAEDLRARPGQPRMPELPDVCPAPQGRTPVQALDRQRPGGLCFPESRGACVTADCVMEDQPQAMENDPLAQPSALVDTSLPPPLAAFCNGGSPPPSTKAAYADTKAWALQKALETRDDMLYRYRACGLCHAIEDGDIKPVRVTSAWFTKAHFTHKSHDAVACKDCHDAEDSEASHDVLLKGKESCQECHAEPHASGKVGTACAACHRFHLEKRPLFRAETSLIDSKG